MASSASAFQLDDQTDEDFFDNLVDDEFDASQSKPQDIARVLSNLSLGDVSASLDDPGELEIADKVGTIVKDDVLKLGQASKEDLLVSEGSLHLETLGSFDSDKAGEAGDLSHGLSAVKSDTSKGTSVKEVQWSAFSVDSSQEFEKVAGFEPYSDFSTQNSDGFFEKPVETFSSNIGYTEQQDTQFYGLNNEQTAEQNDPQYWENLYPGWKFDVASGQWYQVDGYDATTEAQLINSNVASAESVSQSSGVSYLQQSSQSVLETIAEECTVGSVSNWNKALEGSMEYPPNMVFDSQYPGWYYDTNTQQWYTLESYTEGLTNCSSALQDQVSEDVNASAVLTSDQNHSLYSDRGQSESHAFQGDTGQEFGQGWDASYTQQNSLSGNIIQPAQHANQSQGSIDFRQNWDASRSNYDHKSSLYTNTGQSEQTTSQSWGSHQLGQNRNASMGNLVEQNSLHGNITGSTRPSTRSLGSQDFRQNWDAPVNNYAQQGSLYAEQQFNQGQGSEGYKGNWDASMATYAQHSMQQPQQVGKSVGFFGNQQTGNSYGSTPGSQTVHTAGSMAFDPATSQNYGSINGITGFQNFTPKESMYMSDQPKVQETLQSHPSNSYYRDQMTVNYPQQSFHGSNASHSQFSYTPSDGRSSAGRPPHALVTFGFGGKLIVMKSANNFGANLDYGSQESTTSAISVLSLAEVVADKGDGSGIVSGTSHDYFHALCQSSFPGPLVGGSAATKEVNKWLDEKIGKCESASVDFCKGEFLKLLFSLLKIMCQHYGKLRSPFGSDPSVEEIDGPESAVTRLFASAKKNSARLTEFGSLTHCMQNLPSEGQIRETAIEVQKLLVSGRRKEALQYAQEGQLWGPALVLAAQLGEKFYVDTVKKMAQRQFVSGSPLRTLCLLIAGQPADVFSADTPANNTPANGPRSPTQVLANGMLDDWEENLAIITANRTKDDELVIIHLGDCLLKERGEIIAAHTCYLVAEANFGSYSDSARLCLIGADHWKCPRTYASPEAIQRTEVYEYSKVLGNSQFVLLPFQPYKLIYAYMLAEVGKVSDSLRYCQASLKLMKNSGRASEVEMLKTLLSSLEERLRTHQQGGYGSNLAPAKLVGKFITSIDRSIHRMMGAPPAPLPPMPQISYNNKDNSSMPPKVASSQSTMAMSTLMPSQSVEAISEWAGDGSRKPMHNRSVSEPDFGRQNSSKDAGSDDGQSKSSAAPSRFGRIGSQLLQKTMGWVSRSRPDRQAKLGESNKFYYDEKLKRWVEEGAEPPAQEAALPPPPTTAAFQNSASEYNINSAFNYPSPANGGPETKASVPLEPNLGIPPIPPSQNQFSSRGRVGVRARYVDTFNKGGSGGALTNSFQSPAAPAAKPATGAKFFVPMAPPPSDEQNSDPVVETMQQPSTSAEPSSIITKEASSSFPSTSSPPSMQRFPSMDNISPSINKAAASHSINGSLSRSRAASWSGTYSDAINHKAAGMALGSPPAFFPQNPPSTRSSSSSSLQLNGGPLGDELQEVEL